MILKNPKIKVVTKWSQHEFIICPQMISIKKYIICNHFIFLFVLIWSSGRMHQHPLENINKSFSFENDLLRSHTINNWRRILVAHIVKIIKKTKQENLATSKLLEASKIDNNQLDYNLNFNYNNAIISN